MLLDSKDGSWKGQQQGEPSSTPRPVSHRLQGDPKGCRNSPALALWATV
jgi:hypothetical protein